MKRRGLPGWANAMLPVEMEGAAILLGISRRLLVDVIKNYPHYERRGVKKVFYPEHIAALREDLKCQGSSRSIGKEFSMQSAPSAVSVYEKALALATSVKRPNSAPSTKLFSGSVVLMAKRRSAPSRRLP